MRKFKFLMMSFTFLFIFNSQVAFADNASQTLKDAKAISTDSSSTSSDSKDTTKTTETTKTEKSATIFLGDSRFEGMGNTVYEGADNFFVTKVGGGLSYLTGDGKAEVDKTISENTDYTKWSIIIGLGVNDCGSDISDQYKQKIEEYMTGDWKNYNVYITDVTPVDETKCKNIKNSTIEAFNKGMTTVSGAKHISLYDWYVSSIKSGYVDFDNEGLHISQKTDFYQSLFNKIKEQQTGSASSSTDTAQDTKEADKAVQNAINSYKGTEDDIDGLDKKVDWGKTDIDLPDGSDLTSEEKIGIANWGQDVKNADKDKGIKYSRIAMSFAGIIVIIYALLLYLAYWMDRVNNFVEIAFLSVITGGRLTVAPDESSSTFSTSTEGAKTVIHKNMIYIVIIGVGIGVLILSGKMYTLIATFIGIVEKIPSYF